MEVFSFMASPVWLMLFRARRSGGREFKCVNWPAGRRHGDSQSRAAQATLAATTAAAVYFRPAEAATAAAAYDAAAAAAE